MLLRRWFAVLVVFLAGLALSASAVGQDKDKKGKEDKPKDVGKPITLRWQFNKTFFQKMTTKTKQSMKVMNNDVNQTQEQTFYFQWTPVKPDGDNWIIKQKIIGVQMDIDIGGSKISYDSTKDAPANNPLGEFFKALVDSEFTLTVDTKKGTVSKVEGREEFLKKLSQANPQMKPLLDVILSEDALKQMAEPTFAVVPAGAVTVGKEWTRKTSLNMGPIGQYDNEFKYTYEGIDEKVGLPKIKIDTKLVYKAPGDAVGQGGLPFKIKSADLSSKQASGVVFFDNTKGWVAATQAKMVLNGKLSIEIGGQATTVMLAQEQESTVQTTDKNPIQPAKKP